MSGESCTIVKGYRVFIDGLPGEPMDAPSEFELHGWLVARGFSANEAQELVKNVDYQGQLVITLP